MSFIAIRNIKQKSFLFLLIFTYPDAQFASNFAADENPTSPLPLIPPQQLTTRRRDPKK